MEEQKNNKRVLSIELDDEVKKVSITGMGSDEQVVMRQELDENDLDAVTGGGGGRCEENLSPGWRYCDQDVTICKYGRL